MLASVNIAMTNQKYSQMMVVLTMFNNTAITSVKYPPMNM